MTRLSTYLLCALIALFALGTAAHAQDVETEFEDIFVEEFEEDFEWDLLDWTELDQLDAMDGINETELLDDFEIDIDQQGLEAALNEWIIIAEPSDIPAIRAAGLAIDQVEPLSGLGLTMARIVAPGNLDLEQTQTLLAEIAPSAELDVNHLYSPSRQNQSRKRAGRLPRDVFSVPDGHTGKGHKIGVIDTAIAIDHPALSGIRIQTADFVKRSDKTPTDHGTAVLSILAGKTDRYQGLLPDAEYYAASVFFKTKSGGRSAATSSLIKALSWMKDNQVNVINMSLTGPPNRALRKAIETAIGQKTFIIAAIGNKGPNAAPLYPAAYTDVIGVTAVSDRKKIYRLAGRGDHVDFSAPGVRIQHADDKRGYDSSSGTSMAAPFVAAAIIIYSDANNVFTPDTLERLKQTAEDLGAQGFDTTYGYGLISTQTH